MGEMLKGESRKQELFSSVQRSRMAGLPETGCANKLMPYDLKTA
jgi:hypothetical protein